MMYTMSLGRSMAYHSVLQRWHHVRATGLSRICGHLDLVEEWLI
jgi:hypothetical protein